MKNQRFEQRFTELNFQYGVNMKNLLRTAQRELKSLEKRQSKFNGSGILDIYLDFSKANGEPGKRVHLTTIKGVPTGIYRSMMNKFGGR